MEHLRNWNDKNSERVKLQHAYVALAVLTVVAAGLIGLVNYDLGQQLTAAALLFLGMFFINLVAWTLLSGIVLSAISDSGSVTRPATTKRKTVSARTTKKPASARKKRS